MGKIPVRMKAVIYSLSPFQQQVMSGLWKDLPHKLTKKISENWISASLLIGPLLGTHFFCFSEQKHLYPPNFVGCTSNSHIEFCVAVEIRFFLQVDSFLLGFIIYWFV
ncbi:hypothetical protein MKX03_015149 [Papaver bracteatum]|nr:hypothetical protein MKX03_015149 [Papaver bracteatum]